MKFIHALSLFAASLGTAFTACSTSENSVTNGTGSNAGETEIAGIVTATNHGMTSNAVQSRISPSPKAKA